MVNLRILMLVEFDLDLFSTFRWTYFRCSVCSLKACCIFFCWSHRISMVVCEICARH